MAHASILEQPSDRLGRPFAGSLLVHAGIVVLIFGAGLLHRKHNDFGELKPGGAVGVSVVQTIPIQSRVGPVNRLAHDTESTLPQAPPEKKESHKAEIPPPDAIAIPDRIKPRKPSKIEAPRDTYRPKDLPQNQIYSRTPTAAVTPNFAVRGGGKIGVGPNSPLGERFGWYATQIRDLIAAKWNTADISARLDQRAIVTFTILRDGAVRNVQVSTPSGSYTLDNTSRRAVMDANPLPPLPAGFDRNSADVEIYFQLSR